MGNKPLIQMLTTFDDDIFIHEFIGREYISKPFELILKISSKNSELSLHDFLGKEISFQINGRVSPRVFSGVGKSFTIECFNQELGHHYTVTLASEFGLLSLTKNCRVFHSDSVTKITQTVFYQNSITAFDQTALIRQYDYYPLCVQYNESDYNFINRLFEENGIFHFYTFSNGSHKMVLQDHGTSCPTYYDDLDCIKANSNGESITNWKLADQLTPNTITLADYYFLDSQQGSISASIDKQHPDTILKNSKIENYSYPGNYFGLPIDQENAQNTTERKFGAMTRASKLVYAQSNYLHLAAGMQIKVKNPPQSFACTKYLITMIEHHAKDTPPVKSDLKRVEIRANMLDLIDNVEKIKPRQHYTNKFTCMADPGSFTPAQSTPRPNIIGVQTATVIRENTDSVTPYINTSGQVLIKCPWMRDDINDGEGHMWARVGQNFAGAGIGMEFMPRTSQEVLITFVNGNPEKPMVVGSLYNADNPTPYEIPEQQTKSGIRTQSFDNEKSQEGNNELQFDDAKDAELVSIIAQRNIELSSAKNESISVANDMCHTIDKDYTITSEDSVTIIAKKELSITAGGNQITLSPDGLTLKAKHIKMN